MYYYKARYYDPETGRFLQTDPIGYADQMNLYAYVGNDPVNGIDPLGLEQRDVCRGDSCITIEAGDLSQEDTEDFLSSTDDSFFEDNAGRNFSEDGKTVTAANGATQSDAERVAIATQLVGGKISDSCDRDLQNAWNEVGSVVADGSLPSNVNGRADTRLNSSTYGRIQIRPSRTLGRNGGSNTI